MGIMVYSLLWVMQDLYHQQYVRGPGGLAEASICSAMAPESWLRGLYDEGFFGLGSRGRWAPGLAA